MPDIKPESSPALDVLYHVAATVWPNQWDCRVRRCRRDGRCQDRASRFGMPLCVHDMPDAEIDEMLDFVCSTIELATPERVAQSLAQAKTDEEREMIEFRRRVFLYYYEELAKEGLTPPLGPPFIEG